MRANDIAYLCLNGSFYPLIRLNCIAIRLVLSLLLYIKMNDYAWQTQSVVNAFVTRTTPAFTIIKLNHTALPTYTNRIFLPIDWTGSFLIFGESDRSFKDFILFLSEISIFHVYSVGPDQKCLRAFFQHLTQSSSSGRLNSETNIGTIPCTTKV